jgi:hypothetical protein
MEKIVDETTDNLKGQYALYEGQWYKIIWSGKTRHGDFMARLATLPEVWPDREFWVRQTAIGTVRKTRPRPPAVPTRGRLDVELDRRLAREP